jgi:hypothetical protein
MKELARLWNPAFSTLVFIVLSFLFGVVRETIGLADAVTPGKYVWYQLHKRPVHISEVTYLYLFIYACAVLSALNVNIVWIRLSIDTKKLVTGGRKRRRYISFLYAIQLIFVIVACILAFTNNLDSAITVSVVWVMFIVITSLVGGQLLTKLLMESKFARKSQTATVGSGSPTITSRNNNSGSSTAEKKAMSSVYLVRQASLRMSLSFLTNIILSIVLSELLKKNSLGVFGLEPGFWNIPIIWVGQFVIYSLIAAQYSVLLYVVPGIRHTISVNNQNAVSDASSSKDKPAAGVHATSSESSHNTATENHNNSFVMVHHGSLPEVTMPPPVSAD